MIFDSLEEAYAEWKKQVSSAAEEVVPPIMKKSMSDAVKYEVYTKYSPTLYERRGEDGGLADIRNMQYDIEIKDDVVEITLYNETIGASKKIFIDSIVVSGVGYDWKESKIYKQQPYPRDFYEKTLELLNSNLVQEEIKDGLRNRGINVV